MFPGPATSTSYPPGACASSAPTGTTSAFFALAVVMFTVTGAWSKVPAAPGSVSVTVTGIVALLPDPDATAPTEEIVPGVLDPSGSVTVTASPAATCDCMAASSGIVTTCRSDVAASTGPDAGPPRLPITWLTRSAPGSNTTCPRGSDPDGEETPSADCSLATPAAVCAEK